MCARLRSASPDIQEFQNSQDLQGSRVVREFQGRSPTWPFLEYKNPARGGFGTEKSPRDFKNGFPDFVIPTYLGEAGPVLSWPGRFPPVFSFPAPALGAAYLLY